MRKLVASLAPKSKTKTQEFYWTEQIKKQSKKHRMKSSKSFELFYTSNIEKGNNYHDQTRTDQLMN